MSFAIEAPLQAQWMTGRAALESMTQGAAYVLVALQAEGDCWDAAEAVPCLASDRARWVSGQVLTVDGGGSPRMPYPGVTPAPARPTASAL